MKSLTKDYLEKFSITNEQVRMIRKLGEFKGKQELYKKQAPEVLENLQMVALVQSTESSNRLEQVTATPNRFKELMADKTTPQNRSEAEIAGYRDVLNTIHQSANDIPLTVNVILQFHRDMMRYTDRQGGKWKNTYNPIKDVYPDGTSRVRFNPVEPYLVDESMHHLVDSFISELKSGEFDPLILIPLFIFDFTCIHPFPDGNGRTSRLLTNLLLYRQGYDVVRYISLERIIEQTKDSYYETLEKSSKNWHTGEHDAQSWVTYYLSTFLAGYDEFEKRANIVTKPRGTKTEMVVKTIEGFKADFTIGDIEKSCPIVGRDMIRHILNRLRTDGKIKLLSKGKYAKWRKI